MGLMAKLDYECENPNINLHSHLEIVQAFISKPRDKNVIEQFILWASMSKENIENKLVNMIKENMKENGIKK